MGAASSRDERQRKPPQDLAAFRKIGGPVDNYIIPELSEKRRVTDLKFTIIFALTILLLLPFLIYTLIYADLNRLTHGYDDCGNVCGEKNPAVDRVSCSGQDMTDKPFLDVDYSNEIKWNDIVYYSGKCVDACRYGDGGFNRCFHPKDDPSLDDISKAFPKQNSGDDVSVGQVFKEISSDLQKSAWRIVAMCFVALGTCVVMVFLFRFFPGVVVWFILGGSVIGVIALTIFFWIADRDLKKEGGAGQNKSLKPVAIVFTIFSVILVVMLLCLFKKIKLIIRLFKEAMKIIFQMPHILAEPLLSFVSFAILFVIFYFVVLMISTAGVLKQVGTTDIYVYSLNGAMIFTIVLHVFVSVWMAQFIMGCQHMVVAGAVSAYYFARDKASIKSPIYTSFYNLIKYHLGTVAFGSLIITIIAILRATLKALADNRYLKCIIDCCFGAIEDFLRYLSKNAYIQTAMHGQPFFKSGKRAVRLLYANAISAIAVNSVGDFILFMAELLIVVITVALGFAISDRSLNYYGIGILIAGVVAGVLAGCIFSVFETAVDTIFLCFCEDNTLNDGVNRAYYMTTDLMQYMEEAKSAYNKKK